MKTINKIFKSNEDVEGILINTSVHHHITPNQLTESLKIVGPVSTAFNFTIKETAEVIGVMTSHGVNCINGANQLRGLLNVLEIKSDRDVRKFISDLKRIEDLPVKTQEEIIVMIINQKSIPCQRLINYYSV